MSYLRDAPLLKITFDNVAAAQLFHAGKFKDSLERYSVALRTLESLPYSRRDLFVSSDVMNGMSLAYGGMGLVAEAMSFGDRSAVLMRQAYGHDHPTVGMIEGNLAMRYDELGRFDESIEHYRAAVAIVERSLGPEHPNLAQLLTNMSHVLARSSHWEEARAAAQRALDIEERSLPPEHGMVAFSLMALGVALFESGQTDAALDPLLRAARIEEKNLGSDHPYVATDLSNLGELYFRRGEYVAAEEYYRRAMAIREKAFGSRHPKIAYLLSNMGELAIARKSYAAALNLHRRSLEMWESFQLEKDPDAMRAQLGLARAQFGLGHPSQAVATLERALERVDERAVPRERASAEFLLAQALLQTSRDLPRSTTLAQHAYDVLSRMTPRANEAEVIASWLKKHEKR